MKWFKHYSDASFNEKINNLEHEFGYEGYGVYWKITELCSMQWDGKSEPKFNLNQSKIKSNLNLSRKKIDSIFNLCSTLNLFYVQNLEKNYEIYFPKLLEIKDNHTKNLQVNGNKVSRKFPLEQIRKEKKRTEQNRTEESKGELASFMSKQNYTTDEFISDWNRELVPFGLPYCKGLSGNQNISFISILKAFSREDFFEVIETIKHSDFLKSKSFVSAPWVLNEDNFSKILNGTYRNEPEALGEKKYIPKFQEIDAEPIELTQEHMDHLRSILEKGQKRG